MCPGRAVSDREENEDMDTPRVIPAAERAAQLDQRVRATLAPRPELHYPAPWRVAELDGDGHVVIVCEEGHYTCTAPTPEAAEAIVLAVNTFAGVSGQ